MGYMYGRMERRRKGGVVACLVFTLVSFVLGMVVALLLAEGDSAGGTIGVNLTTGSLRVDIVDDEGVSLVGDVLDFVSASEDGEIFAEPGASYLTEGFRIKNAGEIPLTYRVYISEDETVDKESFESAFELYITTNPENTDLTESALAFEGALEAGECSELSYIVVKMKESAGNDFQGKTYTGIGITVYAVQKTQSR